MSSPHKGGIAALDAVGPDSKDTGDFDGNDEKTEPLPDRRDEYEPQSRSLPRAKSTTRLLGTPKHWLTTQPMAKRLKKRQGRGLDSLALLQLFLQPPLDR